VRPNHIGHFADREYGEEKVHHKPLAPELADVISQAVFHIPGLVRRPDVGKLGEQIAVRTYPISRQFPIRDYSHEDISGVVAEFAAIVRV
jgi:hypothetical protein